MNRSAGCPNYTLFPDAPGEGCMTYKLDGAKFPSIEELIEALYPLYSDKMSEEEFRKYVEENAEKHE
jgi:hypothetical protein